MRPLPAVLALALVVTSLPLAGGRAQASTLASRIDAVADTFPGELSVWIGDPADLDPLYEHDADRPMLSASLYKLAVLAAVERDIDLGTIAYDDTIVIAPEDVVDDGAFELPGTVMTVDEGLESMITVSDNASGVHFLNALGPSAINGFLLESGIDGIRLAESYLDDNIATARGVGGFFTLLAQQRLVSPSASSRMFERLGRQQVNDRIPALLPDATPVAHKTGDLEGVFHDAGIVRTPRGDRVIVVMTENTDYATAVASIAEIASAVYDATVDPSVRAEYRFAPGTRAADAGSLVAIDVGVVNAGREAWTLAGEGRVGLLWELRDPFDRVVLRSERALPLGRVRAGAVGSVLVVAAPLAAADLRLAVRLVDPAGRPLTPLVTGAVRLWVRAQRPVDELAFPRLMP